MELLKRILAAIWKTWFFCLFAITFLLLYPAFYITIKRQNLNKAFKLKRILAYVMTYGSGIFPQLTYKGVKEMPQPCIFVANHTSYLDIVLSPLYIDHLALYLGKAEITKAPLFNIFFKGMDIPVNRSSRVDAARALKRMEEEIEKGRSLVIYPEGTIPVNTKKTLPFKQGAFKLAIDKQVPIVPVVHLNNSKLLQNGGYFKSNGRPGIAKIMVFEPIPTKGMTEENLVNLRDKVYHLINNTLNEYYGA